MKRYTRQQAIDICGQELVEKVLGMEIEPTSRLMYPAFEPTNHIGKAEYSPSATDDEHRLSAYWYLSEEEEYHIDEYDWDSNEEWEID